MKKLSSGEDSTLGSYLELASLIYQENSYAVLYLKQRIADSKNGVAEEVTIGEDTMIKLLGELHTRWLYHESGMVVPGYNYSQISKSIPCKV